MHFKRNEKEKLDVAKHIWSGLHTVRRRYLGECQAARGHVRDALLSNTVVSLCVGSGTALRERDHLLERPLAKTNKSTGSSKYGHNSH